MNSDKNGYSYEITKLFPQFYEYKADRRQQNKPVINDRRVGTDRRLSQRVELHPVIEKEFKDIENLFAPFIRKKEEDKPDIEKKATIGALSVVPITRRFLGITDAFKAHDYLKAGGKAFIQYINTKPDWEDMKKTAKDIFHMNLKGSPCQNPFSFGEGTKLTNWSFYDRIRKYDKTLFDIPAINNFLFKIGMKDIIPTENGLRIEGTAISKILGKTFLRMPVLSLAFLGLLEMYSVVKAKNHDKQAVKSTIGVVSTAFFGALLGAIGHSAIGMSGSLAGLGLGSILGSKLANKITSISLKQDS